MRCGPFHFETEGFVSIWIGEFPTESDRENHLRERYEEEFEDQPLAEWMGEFGIGYFDHDFMEANWEGLTLRPIRELIGGCSYAATFIEAAVTAAERVKVRETQSVLLLYHFRYDPSLTHVRRGRFLQFLGAFPFSTSRE